MFSCSAGSEEGDGSTVFTCLTSGASVTGCCCRREIGFPL